MFLCTKMASSFLPYSDRHLVVALYQQENLREEVFRELHRRHAAAVFVYIRRILDDQAQAEDTLQETFVDFLRYVLKGEDVANVAALLFRIARNRCLNIKRSLHLRPLRLDDSAFLANEHDDVHTFSDDLIEQLHAALSALSEEQREAVVLQMYNGLSYQEIAEITEVPLTTVRNRIARAKNNLRTILEPYRQQQR